jgi:hypothetical protein
MTSSGCNSESIVTPIDDIICRNIYIKQACDPENLKLTINYHVTISKTPLYIH